ncbi:hypothetical protein L1887_62293 [Cichorium endivia]|nr:hypothetical protein L1887_62293 [Cichorium endivia]
MDISTRPRDGLQVDALLDHLPERTHVAELVDDADDLVCDIVDLLLGGESADPETQRRVCVLVVEAERTQHVRRLERGRGARRSRREANVLERHEERLALDVLEGEVEAARVAVGVAVEEHVRDARLERVAQTLRELGDVRVVVRQLLLGQTRRLAESGDELRRQRARSQSTLLSTSVDDGLQTHTRTTADVACADTHGPVQLVARQTHEVDAQLVDVERDLACCLRRIGVEEGLGGAAAALLGDLGALGLEQVSDLLDGLDHADLVVDRHDGHERRRGSQRILELLEVDQTVGLHRQMGRFAVECLGAAAIMSLSRFLPEPILLPMPARTSGCATSMGVAMDAGDEGEAYPRAWPREADDEVAVEEDDEEGADAALSLETLVEMVRACTASLRVSARSAILDGVDDRSELAMSNDGVL